MTDRGYGQDFEDYDEAMTPEEIEEQEQDEMTIAERKWEEQRDYALEDKNGGQ